MIVPSSGKQNLITLMDWKCVSDGSLFDLFVGGGSDANTLTEANKRSLHLFLEMVRFYILLASAILCSSAERCSKLLSVKLDVLFRQI